jgi:hypothetical protein
VSDRPPHFPDPNADPIAILEQAISDRDEIIASQYAEMKMWQAQAEAAMAKLAEISNVAA